MVFSFRVYKKSSPEGILTIYLSRVEYIGEAEPVRGVLSLEPGDVLMGKEVKIDFLCSFRYGREEDETLGLSFQRNLLLGTTGIASLQRNDTSSFQDRLIKRLGSQAHPFTFFFPRHSPASVFLLTGENAAPNLPGVDYCIQASIYPSSSPNQPRPLPETTVSFSITKSPGPPSPHFLLKSPASIVLSQEFLFSSGAISLSAGLDKAAYAPGEPIRLRGTLANTSKGPLTGSLRANIIQKVDLSLSSEGTLILPISGACHDTPAPLNAGESRPFALCLRPSMDAVSCSKGNLPIGPAVDNISRPQLAPSTLLGEEEDPNEVFGIRLAYAVRLSLPLGGLYGKLEGELPFLLVDSGSMNGESGGTSGAIDDFVPRNEVHPMGPTAKDKDV